MGSLIAAGAAEGLGKGIVESVDDRQATREKDLDRQHDIALQRMRDQAADKRLQDTRDFSVERYDVERTDQQTDVENERAHQEEQGFLTRGQEIMDVEDKQAHERELQSMQNQGALDRAVMTGNKADWQSVRVKTIKYENGFPVEEEVPLSYQKSTGRYYQERGGQLMPYDLVSNLSEDEGLLARDPYLALAYAQAKGGPEKLPEWFKSTHSSIYEKVKQDFSDK